MKQFTEGSICKIVTNMLQHGLRHSSDGQVRCRSAYILLKIAEGMETKAAALVPIIGSLGGMYVYIQ